MASAYQVLLALPEMAALDDAERSKIREVFRESSVPARTVLYREGDAAPGVYFLMDGFVRLSRSSADGRELVMSLCGPADVFGPCCDLFAVAPAGCTAVAHTTARLLAMPAGVFRSLTLAEPRIARPLQMLMSVGRRGCTDLASRLVFQPVESRVASLLTRLTRWATPGVTPTELPPLLTHADIAAACGTVREVVTRCLAHFEERGLIRRRGRRIVISDPEGLAAVERSAPAHAS